MFCARFESVCPEASFGGAGGCRPQGKIKKEKKRKKEEKGEKRKKGTMNNVKLL